MNIVSESIGGNRVRNRTGQLSRAALCLLAGLKSVLFCAVMSLVTVCAVPDATCNGTPYRRMIEAEDMDIIPGGYAVRDLQRGDGAVVEGCFTTTESLEKAVLSKDLHEELPPGRYVVCVEIERVSSTPILLTNAVSTNALSEDSAGQRSGSKPGEADMPVVRPVMLDVSLGDTVSRLLVPRKSGSCSVAVFVDAGDSFASLRISLVNPESLITLDRVYVSADPLDVIVFDDESALVNRERIACVASGLPLPPEAADTPNAILNGSFEVGCPGGDWYSAARMAETISPGNIDSTHSAHGKRSLRIPLVRRSHADAVPPSNTIRYRIPSLTAGASYRFRGMFRGESPVMISCAVIPVRGDRIGERIVFVQSAVSSNWTPVELAFDTCSQACGYVLEVTGTTGLPRDRWNEEQFMWLDALVLSVEPPDGFVPAAPVEYGVSWDAPARVFEPEGKDMFRIQACCHGDTSGPPVQVKVNCRVIDYCGRERKNEFVGLIVPGGSSMTGSFDPRCGATGVFRLLVSARAQVDETSVLEMPTGEYTFLVAGASTDGMKGTYGVRMNARHRQLGAIARAGIGRVVTSGDEDDVMGVWKAMEPKKGRMEWHDGFVQAAREAGVKVAVNLQLQYPPDYAIDPPKQDDLIEFSGYRRNDGGLSRKAMAEYVAAVVSHYGESVDYWLLVDRPEQFFSAADYFEVVLAASAAAKEADPDCRVLIHSGAQPGYLAELEGMGIAGHIDGMSTWVPDSDVGGNVREFREKHKLALLLARGYSMESMDVSDSYPIQGRRQFIQREMWARIAGIPIRTMCWSGADGFTWCETMCAAGPTRSGEVCHALLEGDGALTPGAAVYAMGSLMLDGFHGMEPLDLNPSLQSYLLEDEARSVLVIMTGLDEIYYAPLVLPDGVELFDMMGNRIDASAGPLLLGADPYFLFFDRAAYLQNAVYDMIKNLKLRVPLKIKASAVKDVITKRNKLRVKVTNMMQSGLLDIRCLVDAPLREFWNDIHDMGTLNPAQTAEMDLDLNVYEGETLHDSSVTLHVMCEACGTSMVVRREFGNVFATERDKHVDNDSSVR